MTNSYEEIAGDIGNFQDKCGDSSDAFEKKELSKRLTKMNESEIKEIVEKCRNKGHSELLILKKFKKNMSAWQDKTPQKNDV